MDLLQKLTMLAYQAGYALQDQLPDSNDADELFAVLATIKRTLDHRWKRTNKLLAKLANCNNSKLDASAKKQARSAVEAYLMRQVWEYPVYKDEFTDTCTRDNPKVFGLKQDPLPKRLWEQNYRRHSARVSPTTAKANPGPQQKKKPKPKASSTKTGGKAQNPTKSPKRKNPSQGNRQGRKRRRTSNGQARRQNSNHSAAPRKEPVAN